MIENTVLDKRLAGNPVADGPLLAIGSGDHVAPDSPAHPPRAPQNPSPAPRTLAQRLNYGWRVFGTGYCFATFGIGGLLLATLAFPALFLLFRDRAKRTRCARWMVHKAFGLFMWNLAFMGVGRLQVEGREHLDNCGDALVLANHPTLIDVVAIISLMPNASCVVKRALWKNPFMAGAVHAANYISNGEPDQLIDDCAEDLKQGNPLVIFPEGTRTVPGQPMRFLRGASYIALSSGKPIVPVLVWCSPTTLTKREKWYQIPHRRFDLRVKILPRIGTAQWTDPADAPAIAARKLTQALQSYFTEQLEHHG